MVDAAAVLSGRALSMNRYPGGAQAMRFGSSADSCHDSTIAHRWSRSDAMRSQIAADLFPTDWAFNKPTRVNSGGLTVVERHRTARGRRVDVERRSMDDVWENPLRCWHSMCWRCFQGRHRRWLKIVLRTGLGSVTSNGRRACSSDGL